MKEKKLNAQLSYQFHVVCERGHEQDVKVLVASGAWGEGVSLQGIRCRVVDLRWSRLIIEVAAERITDSWIEAFIRRLAVGRGIVNITMKFGARSVASRPATEAC
jgi:hypothetical protein